MVRNTEFLLVPPNTEVELIFCTVSGFEKRREKDWQPHFSSSDEQINPKCWWKSVLSLGVDGPGGRTLPMHLVESGFQTTLEI